ncbi:MAG: histidinol dehydrogenase [Gammaproteobacteria bacterium]|nr:histidinol dehydrogenase [Gammaproteobacteria bacterium]
MSMRIVNWRALSAAERKDCLRRPAADDDDRVRRSVRDIIDQVRRDGDVALRQLTSRLDGIDIDDFRVTDGEFETAERRLTPGQLDAIDVAVQNVRKFHEAQLPSPIRIETMPGVTCERVSHPLDAVGLYVPAGTAPLPSAAVMLGVPAAIAGCPRRIMCTPPRKDGAANPGVLVAAKRAGVSDVFRIGGAQAIAAMAFGTDSVPKVNKIFGPGNAWVTEAKSQVAADPGGAAIDMPAGPSEVLVIADDAADAGFIAADLLSQAEHGVDSQVVLVTTSGAVAQAVADEVAAQIQRLSRAAIARESIAASVLIVTDDLDSAAEISNDYAPEHLILHVSAPRELLRNLRNAGSIFLGPWSPESVGDYCSGTNHVLPTYGHARSYSGLSVDQFMRHMTVQELTADGLKVIGRSVIELANLEGLDAHAAAVECRLSAAGTSR